MSNKIKLALEEQIRLYKDGLIKLDTLKNYYRRIDDVVSEMWVLDLISEKVNKECCVVLAHYFKIINEFSIANDLQYSQ